MASTLPDVVTIFYALLCCDAVQYEWNVYMNRDHSGNEYKSASYLSV
jgi:hypothetical protein